MSGTNLRSAPRLTLRPAGDADAQTKPSRLPIFGLSQALALLRKHLLAVLVICLPVGITAAYEIAIASRIYVSEAHFIVRSKATSASVNGLSNSSSLQSLSTMSQANDYTQAVNEYLTSRDLIGVLINNDNLLQILSRPEADFLARFPPFWSQATIEALYRRFDDFVYPSFDNSTGISTLYAYAFRAEDAQRIAQVALDHAEALINRLNARQQRDSIAFAQGMVDKAQTQVRAAEDRVTVFRNSEKLFDPVKQGAAAIELISKLNGDIAELKAELSEVNVNSPGSPKIASIKGRIAAFEQQADEQRNFLVAGDQSLAPKLAIYEKLVLEREMATKIFTSSLLSLESAIKDMDTQRLYLERVVEPNLPDYALYPRRGRVILTVLGFSLCLYWIFKVLGEAIIEHET